MYKNFLITNEDAIDINNNSNLENLLHFDVYSQLFSSVHSFWNFVL